MAVSGAWSALALRARPVAVPGPLRPSGVSGPRSRPRDLTSANESSPRSTALYDSWLISLRASASRAVTLKLGSVGKELREVRELLGVLLSDNLPVRIRKELQSVVQLLKCYLRAAEEPLRENLDVAGLKA
jgi:hypothetical protein